MYVYAFRPGASAAEEWSIVELQGDIQSHAGQISGTQLIGDLHYKKDGTPTLIIGNHLLFGKEAQLDKPLAVLEKHITPNSKTEYTVKALVTRKLIFKTRPKPIIV